MKPCYGNHDPRNNCQKCALLNQCATASARRKMSDPAVPATRPLEQPLINHRDLRPKRGGWAPGTYINTCCRCGQEFCGDKRAVECAECAYKRRPANA